MMMLICHFLLLGDDYEDITGSALILSPSQNSSCVGIEIHADSAIENAETFLVTLSSSDEAVVLTEDSVVVMITDTTTGLYRES